MQNMPRRSPAGESRTHFKTCSAVLCGVIASVSALTLPAQNAIPSDRPLVFFIKQGRPLLLDETELLGVRKQKDDYLEIRSATIGDAPQYDQYYISIGVRSSRLVAEGDCHFLTRLGLVNQNNYPDPIILNLQVGLQYYDFVFSHRQISLKGIQLDAVRYQRGDNAILALELDGKPFTLELIRHSRRVIVRVNGHVLTRLEVEPASGELGISVERKNLLRVNTKDDLSAILRIYDFAASGNFRDRSSEEQEWEQMLEGPRLQIRRSGGAYKYVADRQKYPNVLLIGDSISLYYTDPVRRFLRDKADVFHTPMSPGKVETLFSSLDDFLRWKRWDIIHFNTGLHDFAHRQGTPEEIEKYQRNLEIVIGKLTRTGAKLIWASTTPVPKNAPGTSNDLAIKYNRAAAEVMKRYRIPIDDLYSAMKPHHERYWLHPNNVHFNTEGSAFLGRYVARSILKQLPQLGH